MNMTFNLYLFYAFLVSFLPILICVDNLHIAICWKVKLYILFSVLGLLENLQ